MGLTGQTFNSSPVGDFFGPFFRVAFQAGESTFANSDDFINDADLTTVLGPTLSDSTVNRDTLELTAQNLKNYAASLTIESKAQGMRMFTLTMTPPYEDAVTMVDNRLIRQSSLVKVQWGYVSAGNVADRLSDVHVFINEQPKVSYSSTDVTITLTGYDLFSSLYDRRTSTRLWSSTQYANDAEILIELFESIKFDTTFINTTDTPRLFTPLFSGVNGPKTTTFMGRIQDVSDWQFVRRIAAENQLWFEIVNGNVVLFHDLNVLGVQKAKYNFVFRIQPQTEFDVPVISFVANSNHRAFLPPESFETILNTSNPDDKTSTHEIKQAPKDEDRKSIGTTTGNQPAQSGGGLAQFDGTSIVEPLTGKTLSAFPLFLSHQTGAHYGGPINHPNFSKAVESARLEAQFYANDSATLTAPGVPDITGTTIVTVDKRGVGRSFGGAYLVTGVTHNLGVDGYTMRLDLKRTTGLDRGTVVTNQPDPTPDTTGPTGVTAQSPDASSGGRQG